MKKILTISLAIALAMSLAACGGSKTAPASAAPAPAPASSAAPVPAPAPASSAAPTAPKATAPAADLANPSYTDAQLAVAEKFAAMTDRFQALADTINADANLLAVQELVDTMNTMIEAVNEDDALFADPANLTAEVLANLEEGIVVGNSFLDEMEAMVANYAGKQTVTVAVTIVNSTDADLYGLAMSPANNESWGGNLLSEPLAVGESGVTEMTFTQDTLVWDLLAADSEGNTLSFMGIDFTEAPMEGAQLVLAATEGGDYMAAFAQ